MYSSQAGMGRLGISSGKVRDVCEGVLVARVSRWAIQWIWISTGSISFSLAETPLCFPIITLAPSAS